MVSDAIDGAEPSAATKADAELVDALQALIKEQGFLKTVAFTFAMGSIWSDPSDY